ncbi:outer membrane lipoprotein-sorting protein [Vibrio sp. SCSIO 43132]|uniref:outer membrane lipoprotein-sorting protein n=1 Tax=Vibrio sp. SCSIO 43132 TaxID=2779363 RepID=UPI001CA7F693|nr:outer membrane lipoprotein-sorting protein [Vibrio sp. SCSIO 43132]UAB72567.1 outer membrane lipoprotein-sorting protein [Vibrio sp. SCSIO 43132]
MFNCSIRQVLNLVLATAALLSGQVAANDVTSMLKNADNFRIEEESSKVVSVVHVFKNGEKEKTHQYHVYTRPQRQSLVVFKSRVEAGQKMLMLEDNYWLVMPKSRRPIRITPMQKLLGEASVGDISTLTWSDDYQGVFEGKETLTTLSGSEIQTNKLLLTAKTKGASYHSIELWLEQESDFPVKANLIMKSGKLAKVAWFTKGERNNEDAVVSMTLLDKIQPSKKTTIEYQEISSYELEDKYYNPSFLVRSNVSEL